METRKSWVITGLITLSITIIGFKLTINIPLQDLEMGLGPAFFPYLILSTLVILGLYTLAYGVYFWRNNSNKVEKDRRHYRLSISTIVLLIAYGIFFELIGFLISTSLFLMGTMFIFGVKWWLVPIIATITTSGLYVIFVIFFNVALP